MNWQNNISQVLDIKYPIIQAPMFGVSTPEMVAAASNANCLGSLALGDMSGNDCSKLIRATKQLTDRSFAVNIFVHQIPEVTDELRINYDKTKSFLQELSKKNHLEVEFPNLEDIKLNSYHEQIKAIITEDCKIVSFTFGNLDSESIEKLKNNGTILIGTCTSVNEAVILENSGIDIICVQGIEAGGHRGSFENYNIPQIGGLSLLSQVYDAVKIPIVYAGGIYNHRTLLAAKTLGAQGFQVGTMLMGSQVVKSLIDKDNSWGDEEEVKNYITPQKMVEGKEVSTFDGKNYFEDSFTFEANVPYKINTLENAEVLFTTDKDKLKALEKEVVAKYNEVRDIYMKGTKDDLANIYYDKEKRLAQQMYLSSEEIKNSWDNDYQFRTDPDLEFFDLKPIEKYKITFYNKGKLVSLEKLNNEKSALWGGFKKKGNDIGTTTYIQLYLYRPKAGNGLKLY